MLPRLSPILLSACVLGSASAIAADLPTLPYATRTRGYTAWNTWIRGDIRSIGMSNATVGLGDSWTSVSQNPGGLAMTLNSLSVQINSNKVPDGNTQHYEQAVQVSNFGAVVNPYPWGFSVGYESPHSERQESVLAGTGGRAITELSIKDIQVSASRLALDDRLSVGMSASFSQAIRSLSTPDQPTSSHDSKSFAVRMSVGALYQLPRRVFLGVRWSPSTRYRHATDAPATPALPGFLNQDTYSPAVLGLGLGWIPNSSLRGGFSLLFVGQTQAAALVSDESKTVGAGYTVQPRVGFDYRWLDYKWLEGKLSLGSYYEMSRIEDAPSRLHGTLGVEVNPWVFNVGVALDRAKDFKNVIASIGIDIVRVARVLEFIPPDRKRTYNGVFTSPTRWNDDGLPKPINPTWDPSQTDSPGDIGKIIEQIPERVEKKIEEIKAETEKAEKKALAEERLKNRKNKKTRPVKRPVKKPAPKPRTSPTTLPGPLAPSAAPSPATL